LSYWSHIAAALRPPAFCWARWDSNPQPPACQRSNPALHHVQLFCSGTDFRLCSPPRREPPTISRFAPDKSEPFAGRNNRAELRSLSSTSFNRRSNSSPRHTGIPVAQPILAVLFPLPVGTIGPRKLLELLLLTKQAGFEAATSPIRIGALSWVEVTRTFTTPETFCRGNQRRERFALPLSYSGFRRRRDSNPQLLNEVARAFTTLQSLRREAANRAFFQCAPGASANLSAAGFEPVTSGPLVSKEPCSSPRRKLSNLFLRLLISLLLTSPPGTPVESRRSANFLRYSARLQFPRGITLTVFRDSNPSLSALSKT